MTSLVDSRKPCRAALAARPTRKAGAGRRGPARPRLTGEHQTLLAPAGRRWLWRLCQRVLRVLLMSLIVSWWAVLGAHDAALCRWRGCQ